MKEVVNIKKEENLIDWISHKKTVPFYPEAKREDIKALGFRPFAFGDNNIKDLTREWSSSSIESEIGCVIVDVYVSPDGTFKGQIGPGGDGQSRYVKMSLSECLQRISGVISEPIIVKGEKYYVFQVPLDSFEKIGKKVNMSQYLPPDITAMNFWLSGPGNKTTIHYDLSDGFLVQLMGKKTVLVWNPSEYNLLQLNPLGSLNERESKIDLTSHKDVALTLANVPVSVHQLLPGQILFIPYGWSHYVLTESLSVSVNYWWTPDEITRIKIAYETVKSPEESIGLISDIFLSSRPELTNMVKGMLSDGSLFHMLAS